MSLLQKEILFCGLYPLPYSLQPVVCSLILGAIIGSFLNCLIYRLPRGISLITPQRSFCPTCGHSLAWWENVPLLSWVLLRGRCSSCRNPIAVRYFLVEALTMFLFWLCYERLGWPIVLAGWLFISLLIVATFVDFELMMIPDVITLGGTMSGVLLSFFIPAMMGTISRTAAFCFSLGGAMLGYALLWGALELGKMAFGHRKLHWECARQLKLSKKEEQIFLYLEEEEIALEEILLRPSDKISAKAKLLRIPEKEWSDVSFEIRNRGVTILSGSEDSWKWEQMLPLHAAITEIVLPREAMGFGDVKFLACIGAFLGAKGMIISLFAGSIIGAIVGSLMLLFTRGRMGRCIPFGPYLALGALLWFLKLSWNSPTLKLLGF